MTDLIITFFYNLWNPIIIISVVIGIVCIFFKFDFKSESSISIAFILLIVIIESGVIHEIIYTKVPNVLTFDLNNAKQTIRDANLDYDIIEGQDNNTYSVIDQSPSGGNIVKRDTYVELKTKDVAIPTNPPTRRCK